ncbi:MAG TPA: ABC transporter ATP-binding protein [Acidimicrobiia bacterium]|nr:ABC transporter ATP-binding protein [Acidimicrobiia bacterium]
MLRLTGVRAGYRRSEVLHGVDLVVPPGAAVALLGANGAGKSTLLRVAAGLLPATGGSVWFGDERIDRLSTHDRARRGLCLIPEGRAIFRQLTVRQNLAMQVGGKDVDGAVDRAVTTFPVLGERLGQVAGTLSGGQQQMLAVARALVTDPALVLADELSVGLAPVVVDEIFEAVAALRSAGRSLLIVEQYVDRALAIADYVYIMQKGRVVFVGEPAQCRGGAVFERYLGEGVA